jgi:transcription initiation factor TFIID subunit 5
MSVVTPAASSQSPGVSSPANAATQDAAQSASAVDRIILEYLRSRGHASAEQALVESIEGASPDDKGKRSGTAPTITADELIKKLAVYAQKPSKPGENILKETPNVLQELTAMGNPTNIQNLIASIGSVGAEDIISLDPTDKHEGYRELEAWVDGSLDMYRVCSSPSAS